MGRPPATIHTRQKNTVNILFKNFFVITVGLLLYALGGFNLMYPGFEEGAIGFKNLLALGLLLRTEA